GRTRNDGCITARSMNRHLLTAVLLVGLFGCKKSGPFGERAEPFGPLAKITFGMTDIQVVDKAPEFTLDADAGRATVGEIDFTVRTVSVARVVHRMRALFRETKPDAVTKAWGPGTPG